MHSTDTINQFITLRAQNVSFDIISEKLPISKGTAVNWAIKYQAEIDNLRALELEAIQRRVLASYEEDLTFLAQQRKRIREELAARDLEFISSEFLYNQEAALDSRITKKCALPPLTASPDDDPLTSDVSRGLASHQPSDNPDPSSANTVHDSLPSESLNPSVLSVKFVVDHPQPSTLNSQPSTNRKLTVSDRF